MPCVALPRGGRATPPQPTSPPMDFVPIGNPGHIPPFNDVTDNNPCGKPIVTVVAGVDVSSQNLCLQHYEMKYGQATIPKGLQGGDDAYTVLLLHGETLADTKGHPIAVVGNAAISTTQSVFGGASLSLGSGGTDWFTSPDSPDWAFGAGDFTIDWRVRLSSVLAGRYFIGQYDGTGAQRAWGVYMSAATTLQVRLAANPTDGTSYSFAWSPTAGVWYHIAVVRSGNNLMVFVDGTQIGTTQTVSYAVNDSSAPLTIGSATDAATAMYGNLDEVRISKGIARWTANFTPFAAAYT